MLCDICHRNEALIHIKEIIGSEKKELNLCEECAARQQQANSGTKPGALDQLTDMLLKLGKLAYAAIAVKKIFTVPEQSVRLRVDGREIKRYKKVLFICVLKGAYEGGGFKFCPEGDLRQDRLNVCVVSRVPRLKCLFILPFAFAGKHVMFKGVEVFGCRKLEMELSGNWPVHMDGEVPGAAKCLRVETEATPVQMIC